ncbi:MAG: hypothetical protein ACLTSL_01250 [Odoribacter splanchnicus]
MDEVLELLMRLQTRLTEFNDLVQADISALRSKYDTLSGDNRKVLERYKVAPVLDAWTDYVRHTGEYLKNHLEQRMNILNHYLNE